MPADTNKTYLLVRKDFILSLAEAVYARYEILSRLAHRRDEQKAEVANLKRIVLSLADVVWESTIRLRLELQRTNSLERRTRVSGIKEHSGSKYLRTVHSAVSRHDAVQADVYSVLKAFNVTCPATAHAIKKLLCAGLRGKGDREKDLSEAIDAIQRALEMGKQDLTVREDPAQESDAGGSGALRDGHVNYP